jgi:hypothetical protein
MTCAWTLKDDHGTLRTDIVGSSPREVGRKLLSAQYDAFRLEVSSSYRELFDRAVSRALKRKGWKIVRLKAGRSSSKA